MHGRINKILREQLGTVEGLSIAEATVVSGIGRTKLFAFIGQGSLPARKLGARTIILREDLMKFLRELPAASPRSA